MSKHETITSPAPSPSFSPAEEFHHIKFGIGELAKELSISTRTIRYYEERGMIKPQRSTGGQRFYTKKDRGRLKLILRAKQAGLDLEEAKEVLDLYDILPKDQAEPAQAARMLEMIQQRVVDIEMRMAELSEMKQMLLSMEKGMQEMAAKYE